MEVIKTIDAEGLVLCQDITKIVKDEFKGVAFLKGHCIQKEDIPVLLSLGKEHLFVWSEEPGMIHENQAADILYKLVAGKYMRPTAIAEGKIEVIAERDGLLKVNKDKLLALNSIDGIAVATMTSNQSIHSGQKLAGTRIIPLEIKEEKLIAAEETVGAEPILSLIPFKELSVGIVTTGSEVSKGLIQDAFTPVVKEKLAHFPSVQIKCQEIVTDDPNLITLSIEKMLAAGVDIVFCTGGMSVDPDDRTPLAIKQTGANIISHGTPVLPGSMLLLAYLGDKTIVGLPGGVMFSEKTVFDLILPRLIAQDKITKAEINALGYGGYL